MSEAMGKYSALGDFLRRQKADEIPMTFDRIEKVSGTALPPSARRYRAWWSNNSRNSVMTKACWRLGSRAHKLMSKGATLFSAAYGGPKTRLLMTAQRTRGVRHIAIL